MIRPSNISDETFDLVVEDVLLHCPSLDVAGLARLIGFVLDVLSTEKDMDAAAFRAAAAQAVARHEIAAFRRAHRWFRKQAEACCNN